MPFMYAASSQQNTNASANTDTLLADLKTASNVSVLSLIHI